MKSNPQWQIPVKENHALDAGLYLIATPIGNARDITIRALDTLVNVDILLAEDTRRARQLLQLYQIALDNRPLLACHDHNEADIAKRAVEWVAEGKSVGFVSDAGMPLISDPGFRLVQAMRAADLPYTALPGASSVPTALALSGLPTDKFMFWGFLPNKRKARRDIFESLQNAENTIVFFESAKRLEKTLEDMQAVFGEMKEISIARELTKKYEEIITGTLRDVMEIVRAHDSLKGEIVLAIAPSETVTHSEAEIHNQLKLALKTMKTKDAAREIATKYNLSRQEVYQRAIEINSDKN